MSRTTDRAKLHPQTRVASVGVSQVQTHRPVAPPIQLSATYGWDSAEEKPEYDYARAGNPTRAALEQALAELEGGQGCVVTAAGMSAIDLPLLLVASGGLVIAPHDCYGGTFRLLTAREKRGDIRLLFVDQGDDEAFGRALAVGPSLVMLESPSNPLLRLVDIEKRTTEARAAGALVMADNTFMSPALQNPLALGCDIVVHSTTKYINGHSDVVGGAVIARDRAMAEELAWWANCTGVAGAPFDCYLTLRGSRSLFARLDRQQKSASQIATFCDDHPLITRVHFPGLPSHPGHALARRQQQGFGAMMSIECAEAVDVPRFLRALELFTLAESLGGFESLVCVPARMTHAAMDAGARARAGITDQLVRLSIGLEHPDDLIADIRQALSAAVRGGFPKD